MSRKQKFVDKFWGDDFCSSQGLEVLVKRIKDGRQITKDFEDFLRQRAKIEEDYGRALVKLAKGNAGQLEMGTMKVAWDSLKKHTEETGNEHLEMSSHFGEHAKELNAFGETQKTTRKNEEETVRKTFKKKTDNYKKNTEHKKTYDNKCRELESISQQLSVAKMQGTGAMDKLSVKEGKSKTEQDKADNSYREINAVLEQTRKLWEKDMANLCETYETLEMERFDFLQNEMWGYTNVMSMACVNIDNQCENIRKAIERCDKDADIDEFISQKGTGAVKPATIPYRRFGEPEDNHAPRQTLPRSPHTRPPIGPPSHPHTLSR